MKKTLSPRRRRKRRHPLRPTLRFSPYAWAKLLCLRDRGPTEVGGFAISAARNLLLIEDFCLVKQSCTSVSVRFDDEAVADYFDAQVDQGLAPERFGRIWLHTHPGNSAEPSGTDEETFGRSFGQTDWALMFILARGGESYARLRFNTGPGAAIKLPVEVDFSVPFPCTEAAAWDEEYKGCVTSDVRWRSLSRKTAEAGDPQEELAQPFDADSWLWDDLWALDRLETEQEQPST